MKYQRILSLSGGGLLAKWTLYLMAKLEKDLDFSFLDAFDTFAGISSGSIICGGFMVNKTPYQIFEYYNHLQDIIFKKQLNLYKKSFYALKGKAFHEVKILEQELVKEIGNDLTFAEIKNDKNYFIGTVNISTNKIQVYARGISKKFDTPEAKVIEAILGSSSPPFYLDPIQTAASQLLVDGGVSFINPALETVAASLADRPLSEHDYQVLSLSCPTFSFPSLQKMLGPKKMQYLLTAFKSTIDHDRAKIFTESIIGEKNCLFLEPVFPDAIDFDWIVPGRFDRYFNQHYYLVRNQIREFFINAKIIPETKAFKFQDNEKTAIDELVDKVVIKWAKKEIKQSFSNYLQRLF